MAATREATGWEELSARMRQLYDLGRVANLLQWDQETNMPPRGAPARASQGATLSALRHERLTDERLGELVESLDGDGLSPQQDATLRLLRRERARALRLPPEFVRRIALAAARGVEAWHEARAERDFARFRPALADMLVLKREQADRLGHDGERYDALLDLYEPGMRLARLEPLLDALTAELRTLLAAVVESGSAHPPIFAGRRFAEEAQWRFTLRLLADLGFDLRAGRQDRSAHPFTTAFATGDVRLTTRFFEEYPFASVYATIHECGHGLYEQGIDPAYEGTPLAEVASLGLHESQSRFWENMVGRSRPFLAHYAPALAELHPSGLAGVSPDELYRAVNLVQPSPIRVEADEVTYNLHIAIRVRLELALLHEQLEVADLPGAWADAYERELGIRPAGDVEGVLQDIHWAGGGLGQFPTYTFGNLYAAVLWRRMRDELPGVEEGIGSGRFAPILDWLRERIHRHGALEDAEPLVRRAAGSGLTHEPFVDYLWEKFGPLYGVERPAAPTS